MNIREVFNKTVVTSLIFALSSGIVAFAQVSTVPTQNSQVLQQEIYEVLTSPEPIITHIEADYVNPEDEMAVMIELSGGNSLALEIDLSTVTWVDGSVIQINTNAVNYGALNSDGDVYAVGATGVPALLTAAEENTYYFCTRDDGQGGVIVKTMMAVNVDGQPANVLVDMRMDALESPDQIQLSGEIQWSEKRVWVISWFSDDCKKNKQGCIPGPCNVTLSALIDVASELGLSIPGNKTIQTLTDLLADAGVAVGGDCRPVWFLDIIYVGCQCVLYTFGTTADQTTAEPL